LFDAKRLDSLFINFQQPAKDTLPPAAACRIASVGCMSVSLVTLALSAISGYAVSTSIFWAAQGRIIFGNARRLRPLLCGPVACPQSIHSIRLAVTARVQLEGWATRPIEAPQRRVLIYFGGRNEHVGWVCGMPSYLGPWTIYAFNYRGFGQSGGRSSETTAKADALKIFDEVSRLEGSQFAEMVVVGRSLGTAMALAVAARREVSGLVLLSPFESLEQLVRKRPVLHSMRWALRQKFDCVSDATRVQARTAILLAAQDTRISHPNSLALAARLSTPGPVIVVPGTNHKTLPRHPSTQAALANYLNGS
jgi:pimeloyl-ACP methyl ester carboxylesterase